MSPLQSFACVGRACRRKCILGTQKSTISVDCKKRFLPPNLFPVTGPASLSVLQLNRSELVHMRHVMVKIELDSRLQGGQREVDTMLARLEAGRVCVVCTKY